MDDVTDFETRVLARLYAAGKVGLKRGDLYMALNLYQRPAERDVFERLVRAGTIATQTRVRADSRKGRPGTWYVHRALAADSDTANVQPAASQAYIYAVGFDPALGLSTIRVDWAYDVKSAVKRLRRQLPFKLELYGMIPATNAQFKTLKIRLQPFRARHGADWYVGNDALWDLLKKFEQSSVNQ